MTMLKVPGDVDGKLQKWKVTSPNGRWGSVPWQINHPYFSLACWLVWAPVSALALTNKPRGVGKGSTEQGKHVVRGVALTSDRLWDIKKVT